MTFQRVLVTGSGGLLGQHIVRWLARFPRYDVLATGLDNSPPFGDASFGYVPMDVTDARHVRDVFEDFAPSIVVNCAAITEVDRCESEKELCWRVNVDSVDTLVKQCKHAGARLVQISTDYVFDGEDGPYREDQRPNPLNFYGKSKLAAENAVRRMLPDRWAIARTIVLFGTGESLKRSNMVLWLIEELTAGRPVCVYTDQWRSPSYAQDVAMGIERMIRFKKSGLFHISGRECLSVHEFAQAVARAFDLDQRLIQPVDGQDRPQLAQRPKRTGFIILKAETELGFRPRTLEQALEHLRSSLKLPVSSS